MPASTEAPRSARTRLGVDERRAQLIELGRRLFNERPYDDISIDDIAQAAGVSKGLLYHYFTSKRGFYVEIVRASSEHMREMTEPDSNLPPSEQLEKSLDAYLDYVQRYGQGYLSLVRSGVGTDPEVLQITETMRQVVVRRVLGGLGVDRPSPALRSAIRSWVGLIEGASVDYVEHGDVPRDVLKSILVKTLQAAVQACVDVGAVPAAALDDAELAPGASARQRRR